MILNYYFFINNFYIYCKLKTFLETEHLGIDKSFCLDEQGHSD